MKVYVYLKDPDGFSESVREEVERSVAAIPDLADSEREAVTEARTSEVWKALGKFVEYQEYVGIEFDTEAGTATVRTHKQ